MHSKTKNEEVTKEKSRPASANKPQAVGQVFGKAYTKDQYGVKDLCGGWDLGQKSKEAHKPIDYLKLNKVGVKEGITKPKDAREFKKANTDLRIEKPTKERPATALKTEIKLRPQGVPSGEALPMKEILQNSYAKEAEVKLAEAYKGFKDEKKTAQDKNKIEKNKSSIKSIEADAKKNLEESEKGDLYKLQKFQGVQPKTNSSLQKKHEKAPSKIEDDNNIIKIDNKKTREILETIKKAVNKRGEFGLRGLGNIFRRLDKNKSNTLDLEEFKQCIKECSLELTNEELVAVFNFFDLNGDKNITYNEFIRFLRGDLNKRRRMLILKAYRKLDKTGDGLVSLEDLQQIYDPSYNPEVKKGKVKPEEAIRIFLDQWDTLEKDGIVTFQEFEEFYRDVSASIESDDYFEAMITRAWRLDEK